MYLNSDNTNSKNELNEMDKEKEKQARENHCEIERRRRVKMAAYFNELCSMVPTCNTLQRKPDKLTILRMASAHMRTLRGHQILPNDNLYKPSFLTDQELKHLILEAADGFLFVAQCDTGTILYVSDAIQPVLCYQPNDWYQRSLFEFVHVDDLDKIKEQLSSQESTNCGRVLDLKTGTIKKESHSSTMRSHISSRRAFICRVRIGDYNINTNSNYSARLHHNSNALMNGSAAVGVGTQQDNCDNYAVVHITGYTKSWSQQQQQQQPNDDNSNQFYLIAIARIQVTSIPSDALNSSNIEFVARTDQNGFLTFADQRVTQILGYQPNEMLKKHLCEFCVAQDQNSLKEYLKKVFEEKITDTKLVHLTASNQEVFPFKLNAYSFINPYSDDFEFIVCTFTLQKPNSSINGNSVAIDQQNLNQTSTSYGNNAVNATQYVDIKPPVQTPQPLPTMYNPYTPDAYPIYNNNVTTTSAPTTTTSRAASSKSSRNGNTNSILQQWPQSYDQQPQQQQYTNSSIAPTAITNPYIPYATHLNQPTPPQQQQQHLTAPYTDWHQTNNWQQTMNLQNELMQQQPQPQQHQSQTHNYDQNGYQYMPM